MKLTPKDIEELKTILAACKVIGVEGVVITEGYARGAKPSLDAAIISTTNLSISPALRIGIGRVGELEKRLAIFSGAVEIDGKSNEEGDVSMLTITAGVVGKTKMQFRCTSAKLMKYPKSNDDTPVGTVTMTKAEVATVSKAVKTLGAESIVLSVSRAGVANLQCVDSTNDKFEIELSQPIKYEEDADSFVQTYLAGMFCDVVDNAAKETKETESVEFVVGEVGSLTAKVKGHTVMIFPQISGDE